MCPRLRCNCEITYTNHMRLQTIQVIRRHQDALEKEMRVFQSQQSFRFCLHRVNVYHRIHSPGGWHVNTYCHCCNSHGLWLITFTTLNKATVCFSQETTYPQFEIALGDQIWLLKTWKVDEFSNLASVGTLRELKSFSVGVSGRI